MGYNTGNENENHRDENHINITDARFRTSAERKRMNQKNRKNKKDIYDVIDMMKEFCTRNRKQAAGGLMLLLLLVVLLVAGINGCGRKGEKNTSSGKENAKETTAAEQTTAEGQTEGETAPVLTWQPEAKDSELVQMISSFYQAYIISGDLGEVGKYTDSTTGMDESRLSINKKYIESVSDFVCYKSDLDIVDEKYTVMVVTYKVKLYNYNELLPSIDILFLVNGEAGYKVHNLTVDDEFDKQKIENNQNFQILAGGVLEELNALLAANGDLNEVYNLYLNPNASGE